MGKAKKVLTYIGLIVLAYPLFYLFLIVISEFVLPLFYDAGMFVFVVITYLAIISALLSLIVILILSKKITHSWSKAITITGLSLLLLLVIYLVSSVVTKNKIEDNFRVTQEKTEELENSISVGDVNFEFLGELPSTIYPQYGPVYENLILKFNVNVARDGEYQFDVKYRSVYNSGRDISAQIVNFFSVGDHVLEVLLDDYSEQNFWWISSESTVELRYSIKGTEKELYGTLYGSEEESFWFVGRKTFEIDNAGAIPTY